MNRLPTALRGYTIRCGSPGCRQETAEQAPSRTWRTADRAVIAAKQLGWLHAPLVMGGPQVWFCPMHQAWDAGTRRWLPAPDRQEGRA